jgi:hypothetical protein
VEEIQNVDESTAKNAAALLLVGFSAAFVGIGIVKIARFYDEKRFIAKLKKIEKQEKKNSK